MDQKDINYLHRILNQIEENAAAATQTGWNLDHGHVVTSYRKYHDKGRYTCPKHGPFDLVSFDVAMAPFNSNQCVRGLHPDKGFSTGVGPYRDMRHIATCDPRTMLKIAQLVKQLLPEMKEVKNGKD